MKDFAAEIRAHLDVEHFLSQAQLMLDVQETCVERILDSIPAGFDPSILRPLIRKTGDADWILDSMLHHLLDHEEQSVAYTEAKKVLFTHDSGTEMLNTI